VDFVECPIMLSRVSKLTRVTLVISSIPRQEDYDGGIAELLCIMICFTLIKNE